MPASKATSRAKGASDRTKPASKAAGSKISLPGQSRAVIDEVRPVIDAGKYAVKRVVGEPVRVEIDTLGDGHDRLGCVMRYRKAGKQKWHEVRARESHNDLWLARFTPTEVGAWEYSVQAWVDPFLTWSHDLVRRIEAGQDIETDLEIGGAIIRETAASANGKNAKALENWALRLTGDEGQAQRGRAALDEELAELMWSASPRKHAVESEPLPLWVDRPLALFSSWYELFPRSAGSTPGEHGTLSDVVDRLDYVAEMGFDILYFPPIHPIGETARKGPNNTPEAGPDDVGSPWAIGSKDGGHKSIHPRLGTLDDFDELVEATKRHGMELALDIAFQCAPDHPYVREHPEWFKHRPDGTIQYAENPPKKYQDIYPFDFECDDWKALWNELKDVFLFWSRRGVRVFRVDNPHTKPFVFWDWVIAEVRKDYPDTIFLSEAFTRPKKMYRLAKGGFTQSYTYFAWRNGPQDLRDYVEEITSPPVCDLMRPNFWPNTPDILTEYLAEGGRTAGTARLVLAATLSPSYGIYGPVYELCEYTQRPGAEENLASEKYELRHWNLGDKWSLRHLIARVNTIRREHPALQQLGNIDFHDCDNPAHIAYSKRSWDGRDVILCVVNTNHNQEQWGMIRMDLSKLGRPDDEPFVAHDLLSGTHFRWQGADQFIGLGPGRSHIFHIEPGHRSEQNFETFD